MTKEKTLNVRRLLEERVLDLESHLDRGMSGTVTRITRMSLDLNRQMLRILKSRVKD